MQKSEVQRRILLLLQLLLEQPDEAHYVSVADILRFWETHGIHGNRKNVYSDIQLLMAFGVDIICIRNIQSRYFIGSRPLELPELKLLVDAVESSHLITEKKSAALIEKLGHLTSRHNAAHLNRPIYMDGTAKPDNETVYYAIDAIQTAIHEQHANTINMKYNTKSYKDRRKVEHPREECIVIEGSHEAIIDRETWDIVQRVRQNRRRPTKMKELNKYSGLVVCADCGSTMVLHRAHTMSASYNHFTCRTYKKEGVEVCTVHYIRECILDEIVLEDIRRVTAMAREHTQEFAAYICDRQSAELRREIRRQELELSGMKKHGAELEAIFKWLYEDSVLGRITTEQFQTLSASYVAEQEQLKTAIPQKEREVAKLKATASGTDNFIARAKRYTDIKELTPELLRLFIEKIVVHEKAVKWSKQARQTVEIHYTDIGVVEAVGTTKSA